MKKKDEARLLRSICIGDFNQFLQYFENEKMFPDINFYNTLKMFPVDINWKSLKFEETPLFMACKTGRLEIVEYMLASKREMNILSKNYKGILPLEIAKINSEFQEKLNHEKEDDEVKERQNNCSSIYNLLQKYQANSKEMKKHLREKLKLQGIFFFNSTLLPRFI